MEWLDYGTLRVIWWALLGVLLIGFAVTDGFDFGSGILLPIVGKNDAERRVVINTVGPVWEGNQVWFILGGGAIFAAWPALYAMSFSGFYLAMFLVLCALILRPVSFKFRSKLENPTWRNCWDWALFVSGLVPPLVFGVAFGNVLQGVDFHYDDDLRLTLNISLFGLLNPFALLCGLVSVAMVMMHAAAWLSMKTVDAVQYRAARTGAVAALAMIVLFVLAGIWVSTGIHGYVITSAIDPLAPSNPLGKTVTTAVGGWMHGYSVHPWAAIAPIVGLLFAAVTALLLLRGGGLLSLITSGLATAGVVATPGFVMFPFLMPSITVPGDSLTVWDASSSALTLKVMVIAAIIFVPIILAYTSWVYRVMRGPVTTEYVTANKSSTY